MDFEKVVNERFSARDFSNRPISNSDLQQIVSLAQQAPSWVNSQPWKVYIATGKHLQQIRQLFRQNDAQEQKSNPDVATMHRDEWGGSTQANMRQWRHEIVNHFDSFDEAHETMTAAMLELNHAPVIAYITIPKATPEWSVFDAGAFAQTLMLAARNLGIDSIPTYNSVRYSDEIKNILGISAKERLIIGIELGYATDTKINDYRSKRVSLNQILNILD